LLSYTANTLSARRWEVRRMALGVQMDFGLGAVRSAGAAQASKVCGAVVPPQPAVASPAVRSATIFPFMCRAFLVGEDGRRAQREG
jgi:hypothetical protein